MAKRGKKSKQPQTNQNTKTKNIQKQLKKVV